MPHAEYTEMGEPTMNGDAPHSLFFSHLTKYPAVSDSISTFKSMPLGQKSIQFADHGYETFVKPVQPYLVKPYTFVSPYVSKADKIADSALNKVDSRFPIVKEPTDKIRGTVTDYAFFPLRVAFDGKDYVFRVYGDEVKKAGNDGIVAKGKASLTTGFLVTADLLSWISSYVGTKKEQAKEVVNEKTNN